MSEASRRSTLTEEREPPKLTESASSDAAPAAPVPVPVPTNHGAAPISTALAALGPAEAKNLSSTAGRPQSDRQEDEAQPREVSRGAVVEGAGITRPDDRRDLTPLPSVESLPRPASSSSCLPRRKSVTPSFA